MAKAKTLSLVQIVMLITLLVLFVFTVTFLLISPKDNAVQVSAEVMSPEQLEETAASSQMHLDAYATQIGELQARIMRLDAQNKRLVKLAGVKELKTTAEANIEPIQNTLSPSLGGPLVGIRPMTEEDLKAAVLALVKAVDDRDEYMNMVEADVLQDSVLKDMLPNSKPIRAAYNSSSYGWRIDPFRKTKAFHEGLDFTANTGTSIRAAADGIVVTSGRSSAYGKMVKIDHGAGLETRYAHASKLLVKAGERVVKGQVIAKVGSTGRSTGPHLHYEIRLNGHSLDPKKYLNKK